MPRVFVIIVNHQAEHLLPRCVAAIARQSLQPCGVIVVDNPAPGDETSLDRVRAAVEATSCQNLRVIGLPKNVGFAAANNRAVASCSSEFVALVNPDAFPRADWLERMLAAATRHPAAAAFGSRQMIDGRADVIDGIGDAYHVSGLAWRQRHGRRLSAADLVEREIFSPCAAAAVYRRDAFVAAGGFDEDFFCYFEDVDLGFRLRLAGHRAVYVPDAVVEHVGGGSSGNHGNAFATYHGHRNLVWSFAKNMPLPLLVLLIPLHLIQTCLSLALCASRGESRAFLQAKRDAIGGLPRMLAKRSDIQGDRRASVASIWNALTKRVWRS
jgi:GT2 family glycosyltransferase